MIKTRITKISLGVILFVLALMYPRAEAMASVAPGGAARSIAISPNDPNTMYAATYAGVFKTTNGGASWSSMNTGLTASQGVGALAIDGNDPETLYASASEGVFKTMNGGENWSEINRGLITQSTQALAIDPDDPSLVYAGTVGGAYKSTNGGGSWAGL